MANGDAAAAAGLQTVPPSGPTGKARLGYDWINYVMDRVVTRVFGTGQIADGAVTPAKLSGAVPVANGGTGATTAAQARTNLGAQGALGFNPVRNNGSNQIVLQRSGQDIAVEALIDNTMVGRLVVQGGGDFHTGGGRVNSIGSRNFPVSVNYASAYFDGDNWLGITPSARKFKQDIRDHAYTLDQAEAIRLVAYRLKAAVAADPDASWEPGVIAEELLAAGLGEFVIHDANGDVQSVSYERLVLVALGAVQDLGRMVRDQASDLADLTARVAALEGTDA